MKTLALLAALSATLVVSIASAGDKDRMPPSFGEIDTNDDALISQEELAAFAERRMAERGVAVPPGGFKLNPVERADTDGDGYLSEAEFDEMITRARELMRKRGASRSVSAEGDAT